MGITIEVNNPEEVVKEALWIAWNACGSPMGMGVFQNHPDATKDDVWNNVACAGDYPGGGLHRQEQGDIYGDYVFGRMMKIGFQYDDESITVQEGEQRPDYQGWSVKYPTYPELIAAAVQSLESQAV